MDQLFSFINLNPHYSQYELLLGFKDLVVDVVFKGLSELALLSLLLQLRLCFRAAATLCGLTLILSLIPLQSDIWAGVCGRARRQLHSCRGKTSRTTLRCCHLTMRKTKHSLVTCSSTNILHLIKIRHDSNLSGSNQTCRARCLPLVSGRIHGSG